MWSFGSAVAALLAAATCGATQETPNNGNFTIINGQIYTPGLAIIDSPQPNSPEGGDYLQVAIDVSGDGRLPNPQPPTDPNVETGLFNITLFLTSYAFGLNFTISNGTSFGWLNGTDQPAAFQCPSAESHGFQPAGCQEVMTQEPGSTVKHVNWVWPDCLVGHGGAGSCGSTPPNAQSCLNGNARGGYNISIHQSFRLNGSSYYTIFDLPISVTNSIPNKTQSSSSGQRPLCALLNNPLLSSSQELAATNSLPSQPYLGGSVAVTGPGNASGNGNEMGNVKLATGSLLRVNPKVLVGLLGAAAVFVICYV